MVRIRLARGGAKKRPYYRIVVADGQSKRDGRFLESIGTYDPKGEPYQIDIKEERLQHWVAQGAKTSTTVRTLLKNKGIKLSA